MNARGPLRCIGGPRHGHEHVLPGHYLAIPVPLSEPARVHGPDEEIPLEVDPWGDVRVKRPPLETVTYERRVIVAKDDRLHYAETCLVPQGMSESEAWRLIQTLGIPGVSR